MFQIGQARPHRLDEGAVRAQQVADPQPGNTEDLAQALDHHQIRMRLDRALHAAVRTAARKLDERLVDDQPAVAGLQTTRQPQHVVARHRERRRVVRRHHDRGVRPPRDRRRGERVYVQLECPRIEREAVQPVGRDHLLVLVERGRRDRHPPHELVAEDLESARRRRSPRRGDRDRRRSSQRPGARAPAAPPGSSSRSGAGRRGKMFSIAIGGKYRLYRYEWSVKP